MFYEVKIWGNKLICDICSNYHWSKNIVKVEFEDEENAFNFNEEVRYLFECRTCGNCRIFGMVSDERNMERVNITTSLIQGE